MMKELVVFVVQQLVSHPDDVVVKLIEQENINILEIKVAPDDRGRVIGKDGYTIKSLRTLLDAMSVNGKKVSLELFR